MVELDGDGLGERLAASFEGAPLTLVFDALWGPAVEAATIVAAPGARIAQVGLSGGATATLASGVLRSKSMQILGYTNFAVPMDALAQGYADLLAHATAGRITIDIEAVPLAQVAEAWARQQQGSAAKLVLVP